jgi:hypothetical protein
MKSAQSSPLFIPARWVSNTIWIFLSGLARAFGEDASVVVVGRGTRFDAQGDGRQRAACTVKMLPPQPFDRLSSAGRRRSLSRSPDSDAGTLSVPSKVQPYLCAGRPILLAAPAENLAARIVARENAGLVVHPE